MYDLDHIDSEKKICFANAWEIIGKKKLFFDCFAKTTHIIHSYINLSGTSYSCQIAYCERSWKEQRSGLEEADRGVRATFEWNLSLQP